MSIAQIARDAVPFVGLGIVGGAVSAYGFEKAYEEDPKERESDWNLLPTIGLTGTLGLFCLGMTTGGAPRAVRGPALMLGTAALAGTTFGVHALSGKPW